MAAGDNKDSYACLNVGGTLYSTTLSTLTSYPTSMLGVMFREGIPATQDPNGYVFIDRDGTMFRYVLNFMRDKKLCLPSSFVEYDQLLAEAEFFQLPDLKEAILLKMSKDREVVILTRISVPNTLGLPSLLTGDGVCSVHARKSTWPSLKYLNNSKFPLKSDSYSNPPSGKDAFIDKHFEMPYFSEITACLIEDGFNIFADKETARNRDTQTYNVLLFSREASKS